MGEVAGARAARLWHSGLWQAACHTVGDRRAGPGGLADHQGAQGPRILAPATCAHQDAARCFQNRELSHQLALLQPEPRTGDWRPFTVHAELHAGSLATSGVTGVDKVHKDRKATL